MTTILLIRHGENEYVAKGRLAGRLPGVCLNAKGKTQANTIAAALEPAAIKAIYSSPMERCMETAYPLAKKLGQEIVAHDGLIEIDYGEWQNKTLKQLHRRKLWKTVQKTPSMMQFPHGETFANAQTRIVSTLQALSQQHKPQDLIACFSHSDIIKLAVAYFLGTPLDLFQRIVIQPASISTLYIHAEGIRVLNVNHHAAANFLKPKA
jgi:probable phosphoglycerate mutase